MRRKRPASENIGIDKDGRIVAEWRRSATDGITVIEGDAVDVLPDLTLSSGDLVYADPPYLRSSRRSPRLYRHDYCTDDHERLLAALLMLPCAVIVSGYRSDLYDDRLRGWSRTDYVASTHRGQVIESAWTNFEPGSVLHDYSCVGSTFRERERFRRQRDGLVKRIAGMGTLELNAALAEIADQYPEAFMTAFARAAP